MMEAFNIAKLGSAGIISDVEPMELPLEAISNGNNIRITNSGISISGGYSDYSTPPVDLSAGFIISNPITSINPKWIVCGTGSIYAYASVWTDISPTVMGTVDRLSWTGCNLGKLTMVNSDQPYWYDNVNGGIMTPLPFSQGVTWPDLGYSFKVIRSYKSFLFALNLTEGGVNYPDSYRWSHPADANGYPFTWDPADLSALASRESLGGNKGAIVDGLKLRDSFVIYSEAGVDVLDYTDDNSVFRRRSLTTTKGLISKDCVVEVGNLHYYISDGDIMVNDGTTITSILKDLNRSRFSTLISTEHYKNSYVVENTLFNEIWFCIPTKDAVYPNKAFVYNHVNKGWSLRGIPENTPFAAEGSVIRPEVTWNAAIGTWNAQRRPWRKRVVSPEDTSVVGVFADSSLSILEVTDASVVDFDAFVERISLPIGGNIDFNTINRIYPHISGSLDCLIQIGSQEFQGGPITWAPQQVFNPSLSRKLDVRSSGNLFCYRISSSGRGTFKVTGMDIEYVKRGKR